MIKDLAWFGKAVEMASLHAAADALGISQPALSKAIRRLEAEFGVRLLERTPRGVAPTPIGEALYQRARLLGGWVHDTRVLVHDLKTGQSGELRVGVVPALVESVLTPVLGEFLAEGSAIRFHTSVQLSAVLLQQLEAGALDVAIAAVNPERPSSALASTVLGTQSSHVVARLGHPLQGRRFTLGDLAAQPWVLPPANISLRAWVDALFVNAGIASSPAFVHTDATPAVFAELLRRTDALTVMANDSLASSHGKGLRPLPLPAPHWTLQLGLFWRRSAYFSATMSVFRERVIAAFANRGQARH
ncbi:LysR family transcriptional regulator [Verticiella sediminum]|uniref:LysR family transcriptional regulator n=1 Tax=Verticiella sediminum TaxID=1247510 RepID=UPI00147929A7|nr:LysR family transcriptional regulator [Verticiella sediminum]